VGDPSLRLKNGFAQDDNHRVMVKLHHYLVSGAWGGLLTNGYN